MNRLDSLIVKPTTAQTNQVNTRIADRFLAGDDIGWDVLTGA